MRNTGLLKRMSHTESRSMSEERSERIGSRRKGLPTVETNDVPTRERALPREG